MAMNPDVGLIYNPTDLSPGPQTVPPQLTQLGNGSAYMHSPSDPLDTFGGAGAGPSGTFSVAPGAEHSAHKLQQQLLVRRKYSTFLMF